MHRLLWRHLYSWYNSKNYDVMGSLNYNHKIHGSRYLIADVLKEKMGFDGVVVTDWNGHSELNDCTAGDCPQVVLAGNDIIMVTARQDWQEFYKNTVSQVRNGTIPLARVDDAVTRILRVKHRAGLWEKRARAVGGAGTVNVGRGRAPSAGSPCGPWVAGALEERQPAAARSQSIRAGAR